jgi:hypothetical protein
LKSKAPTKLVAAASRAASGFSRQFCSMNFRAEV